MSSAGNIVRVPCPICGSTSRRDLFLTKDYKQGITDDQFIVSRCLTCRAGYLSTRPSKQELPRYYDEHFYWSHENDESAKDGPAELLANRLEQLEAKAAWLKHLPPGRLLDIGTMKGEFLHFARNLGWDCTGVEFSSTPPNLFNMPIVYGEFLTMNEFEPASFDCITMWAVLEHIYEPMEYVKRVSTLLKADGRFIFLVTNFNSIQGRCYEMDDYPRHLNLFTKRAVRYLLDQSGLELVRVSTDQSIFGGHLQGGLIYCAKRLFGYSREDALTEWKSDVSLQPFFHLWRGNPSAPLRLLARIDRLLLSPAEWLLDRLGFGFTLTVEARKAPALNEFTTKEG